jgi:hypothetical protein
MKKFLATILLSLLLGCGGGVQLLTSTPDVVSTDPNNWNIQYSTNMPIHPMASSFGAWEFDFPITPGSVNYVTVPYFQTIAHTQISMTFEIVTIGNVTYNLSDPTVYPPESVRLFFQECGDNLSAQGPYAAYRWWSYPLSYNLGTADNTIVTLTVPLVRANNWVDVYNVGTDAGFQGALNNLCDVGMTFGGLGGLGHGVSVTGGTAKFVLISYSIT